METGINFNTGNSYLLDKIIHHVMEKKRKYIIPKIKTEDYIVQEIGDIKLNYTEMKEKIKRLTNEVEKINIFNYTKHEYVIKHNVEKLYNRIVSSWFNSLHEITKEQLNILGEDKAFLFEKYHNTLDFQLATKYDVSYRNFSFSILRNHKDINYGLLKDYISKYYTSKEDFIVDILIEEISFLHEFSIFGNELLYIGNEIGFVNSRQFTVLIKSLSSIFKYRFYDKGHFDMLNKKFKNIIIEKLKNKQIPFDGSTSKTLLELHSALGCTYSEIKDIIFAYANDCCGVICGNRTLTDYNLPFKNILTTEDYEILIESVVVGEVNDIIIVNIVHG